jgi:hypothetical protein
MKRRSIKETLFKFQTVRNLKFMSRNLHCIFDSIWERGGRGGIKVYPPSKIFAKLVNKNAIKHQKGVPSPQNFHNPYIPSHQKFGKNLMDPPSGFSNCVHL